ncbi:MAG: aldolase [Chthoniobacterales bacterium]|nr:aldolase [Chthoniobacterales bacterium]
MFRASKAGSGFQLPPSGTCIHKQLPARQGRILMANTTFKEKLAGGAPILGTFLQIPAAELTEIFGFQHFDFGIVDAEHGTLGVNTSIELLRACAASGLASVYRVPGVDAHKIGHVLDLGASAVMVPNIQRQEAAERAVRAAKYYPAGNRGVCPFTRAAAYNGIDQDPDYYNRSNRETAVILQIEGIEGVQNLDQILAVPGIDGIFIGPFDLSQSLGIPGEVNHARVLEAIEDIVRRAGGKNIAVGIFAVSVEQVERYVKTGVRFIAYGTDTLIVQRACRDLGKQLQQAARNR